MFDGIVASTHQLNTTTRLLGRHFQSLGGGPQRLDAGQHTAVPSNFGLPLCWGQQWPDSYLHAGQLSTPLTLAGD